MKPIFFRNQAAFRRWLEKNHKKETEIIVGFFKMDSGKPNMTWSQSVDEALCFGWIDGVRRSIDSISYCIRFTPRRAASTWSTVNIKKVEELLKNGRMQPSGLEIFNQRREEKSGVASYENDAKQLDEEFIVKFKANRSAWDFFTNQAPSYQKMIIHWIMAAKQEATKLNRLEKTIRASEIQKRVL